ncbi:MAG: hypothetical protein KME22_08360 [Hassallia sp. WJT32-NPBG1]|nr:hypothetical protein [Hassallia sp. WJT32-NPBG1]
MILQTDSSKVRVLRNSVLSGDTEGALRDRTKEATADLLPSQLSITIDTTHTFVVGNHADIQTIPIKLFNLLVLFYTVANLD